MNFFYRASWLFGGMGGGTSVVKSNTFLARSEYIAQDYRIVSGPWPSYKEAEKGKVLPVRKYRGRA